MDVWHQAPSWARLPAPCSSRAPLPLTTLGGPPGFSIHSCPCLGHLGTSSHLPHPPGSQLSLSGVGVMGVDTKGAPVLGGCRTGPGVGVKVSPGMVTARGRGPQPN